MNISNLFVFTVLKLFIAVVGISIKNAYSCIYGNDCNDIYYKFILQPLLAGESI